MAERKPWAVTDSDGEINVDDARLATGALWTPGSSQYQAKTGFRPGPGGSPGLVTATSPTANGFVHVAPHQLVMQTSRAPGGGSYICTLDAIKDINVLATPAHTSNPRDDLIVAQVTDTFYGDPVTSTPYLIRHVVGTPSGTPALPAVSGSPDYITLAKVRVRANTSQILSTDITDLRPSSLYTVAVGGLLPVGSQAERNALAGVYDGLHIWRQDRDWIEVYDGGAWRVQGIGICSSVSDFSAVTSPSTGQHVFNTGDGQLWRWTGSTWVPTRSLGGVVAGSYASPGAAAQTSIGSAEKDVPRLALTGKNLRVNDAYRIVGHLYTSGGVTGDSYHVRIRRDTPLTGTIVISTVIIIPVGGFDAAFSLNMPWVSDANYSNSSLYLSVQRIGGSGTISLSGDGRCHVELQPAGAIGGSAPLWSIT